MTTEMPKAAERFRSDLLSWAEDRLREYPWRHPSRNLYEVFIAEFFLTQTPADNVARVYPDFLDKFPDLHQVDNSTVAELEEAIEPLGFQRMRAEALSEIASEYADLPNEPGALEELTRVGPYVANATVCIAGSRALPILDRNVKRVYKRVFDDHFPDDTGQQLEFVSQMLPNDGATARTYNLALLDYGALVCTKRDPECERCFAPGYCDYYRTEVRP